MAATNELTRALGESLNAQELGKRLTQITEEDLVPVLHAFALFNDALAARVPLLAGVIHATPRLFTEGPPTDLEFCRRRNAQIASYVAYAASDEYSVTGNPDAVHQQMSQRFLASVIRYFNIDNSDPRYSRLTVTAEMAEILDQATRIFLIPYEADHVLSALGFHVALEFSAGEEFRAFDHYLRSVHPGLVKQVEDADHCYDWIRIHTTVEDQHYAAGLEAIYSAVRLSARSYRSQSSQQLILDGIRAFATLQKRYYETILAATAP